MSAQPYGLPLNETILPQFLKQLGYSTHIVGKVNITYFWKTCLPSATKLGSGLLAFSFCCNECEVNVGKGRHKWKVTKLAQTIM